MISLRRKEPEPPTNGHAIIQGKPKKTKQKVPFLLELNVFSAFNIDGEENPNAYYFVVASVEHGQSEKTSSKRRTFRWVGWKEKLKMLVWEHKHHYLYLEVVRLGVFTDPGSSTGQTVVGRARVRLPNVAGVTLNTTLQLVQPEKIAAEATYPELGAWLWVEIVVNSLRWD